MKPRLLFELPVLRRPTAKSFDTQQKAVEAWLAALPMASVGETCRQIFVHLYEVNRTQTPVAERLTFLERLAEPLATVLPALQKHFIGQSYPLTQKAHHVARLSTDLQVELVIGYRLVLEGVRRQPWYRRWGQGKHKALAAHRILHYLSNILSDYQWLHMPYPRGVWHVVHGMFLHEERRGRASIQVAPLAGRDGTTMVAEEYKRLLLRALLPPSRVHAEQWRFIDAQLDNWLPLVSLDASSVESGYLVRLTSDIPPTELPVDLTGLIDGRERFTILNTRRLVEHLDNMLLRRSEPAKDHIARETLETLRNVWRSARARRAARQQGSGESLEMVVGIHAIHRLLTAGDGPTGTVVLALEELDSPPVSDNHGAPHKASRSVSLAPKSWASSDLCENPPKPVPARLVDLSESGYGLRLGADTVTPLKEGELIALRLLPQRPWEVGYVCWLREEPGSELSLGVQHLATEVLPVEVSVRLQEGNSAPISCLLGTTQPGETGLFIPHLSGLETKAIQLSYRGHDTPITLLERLDGSAEFTAYLFDTPRADGVMPAAAAGVEQDLRRRTEAKAAAVSEAARFADIWPAL